MSRSVLLAVLLFSTTATADVIFPAFSAAYVSAFLFPLALVAALFVEGISYRLLCKSMDFPTILLLVILVNLVSWFAGILITNFLPSGLITDSDGRVRSGPQFMLYAKLGFFVAYVLSVIIEGATLKLASYKFRIEAPWKLSLVANTASYLALSVIVWALM